MMRRYCPVNYEHVLGSDSETDSGDNIAVVVAGQNKKKGQGTKVDRGNVRSTNNQKGKRVLQAGEANQVAIAAPFMDKVNVDRGALLEIARKYQKQMKKMAIPKARLGKAVVHNWQSLAKLLKTSYGQPLHYLTYMSCKEWDRARFGSEDEAKPLGDIYPSTKAEDTIWNIEEIHRLCTSHVHLAQLWLQDPEYHSFVDEVVPSP